MKKIYLLTYLIIILTISGCSSKYESINSTRTSGYMETKVGEDTYDVKFVANGYTPVPMVNQFVLARSVEVTIEKGYKYFIILESSNVDEGIDGVVGYKIIKCFKDKPKTEAETLVYDATLLYNKNHPFW